MALQLGALRDARIEAGVNKPTAGAAAEEVAGYENRLTLTTLVQAAIAVLVVLLGSQAALWAEMGKISGQVSEVHAQLSEIARTVRTP